jgi:energy-coupling factor transporter ATP-binding protein EcfA2
MVEYLKIPGSSLVRETLLERLGQINVVCGRNNSGKSTLLRALADSKKSVAGRPLTEKEANDIALRYTDGTIFQREGQFNTGGLAIVEMFKTVSKMKPVWYADEVQAFVENFVGRYTRDQHTRGYQIVPERAATSFNNLMPQRGKAVLISPKRHLATLITFAPTETLETDGRGLVNKLFYLKNQQLGTPARDLHQQILDAFAEITGGYSFDVVLVENNNLSLRFKNPTGAWAQADECGLGLQDMLVILSFCLTPDFESVLLEEPETHAHPDMQRKLLIFMRGMKDKQFFISTHSNVFLDAAFVDKVLFTTYRKQIEITDETRRAFVLSDLGYQVSDNLVSDAIVLVEGPKDVPVIGEFLHLLGVSDRYAVKYWPLGGDIMDQLDLTVFSERYKIMALVDSDPGSKSIRDKFVEKCKQASIPVRKLERYALENYFSIRALQQIYKGQFPSSVTELAPNVRLDKQLGFDVKQKNRQIARAMTLEDLQGTDLLQFLNDVKTLCETAAAT